jgi:cysteinyl-tRNA synthetase
MNLLIYNTLSRKKEKFKPMRKKVNIFVCGPTVWDSTHLGHARTYIAYDIITRWLKFRGYDLYYLMNITDVDDKIINRSIREKVHPSLIAKKYEESFFKDMKSLGIDSIDMYARSSEHIPEIIDQIRRLIDAGFAYKTRTGVYFDISKFEQYGKLSHQKPEELERHRIEPDPTKKNPQDFSLWKITNHEELSWASPWGRGRPGWHIEDTAISEKYLGQQYDIHGGGIDLIFPHHDSEIAQMESVSGKKPMVKYWVHTGFLMVKGKKMAKSLGNYVSVQDALKKFDRETIRLFFSMVHYRGPINYDDKNLIKAKRSLESLHETLERVQTVPKTEEITQYEKESMERIGENRIKFEEAMDDDFNTSLALSHLFNIDKGINKLIEVQKSISIRLANIWIEVFMEMCDILGIIREKREEKLPEELMQLITLRENARKERDWKTADKIRDQLKERGIILEDSPQGFKWKKIR